MDRCGSLKASAQRIPTGALTQPWMAETLPSGSLQADSHPNCGYNVVPTFFGFEAKVGCLCKADLVSRTTDFTIACFGLRLGTKCGLKCAFREWVLETASGVVSVNLGLRICTSVFAASYSSTESASECLIPGGPD